VKQVTLAAAAASDPHNVASCQDDSVQCQSARQKRHQCYLHIINTLRSLLQDDKPNGSDESMSVSERTAYKNAILRAAARSSDPYFHAVLYEALIDIQQGGDLLLMETPYVEPFLLERAGLSEWLRIGCSKATVNATGGVIGAVGPLSQQQVHAARLLAKLYVVKHRCEISVN